MKRTLKATLVIVTIVFSPAVAGDLWDIPIMPLADVRPGMKGMGKTVFYGNRIEEFGVEILEISENFSG